MPTNTLQNPDDFLPLTPAEFHILLVLADRDLHGYGIMRLIEQHSDGKFRLGPGTLYSTIKRLLDRGWIVELDERPDPDLDDERRRYYRLDDIGARVLRAEALRLSQIVDVAREIGVLKPGGAT